MSKLEDLLGKSFDTLPEGSSDYDRNNAEVTVVYVTSQGFICTVDNEAYLDD